MPVSKKRKPKKKTGSNRPLAGVGASGLRVPRELRSFSPHVLEALVKLERVVRGGADSFDVKAFATILSRGKPPSAEPRDEALASRVRKYLPSLMPFVDGAGASEVAIQPGYLAFLGRDSNRCSLTPYSGLVRDLDGCCVDDMLDALAGLDNYDVAVWVATGPVRGLPPALVAADRSGGRVAFLWGPGGLEQLSSLDDCESYLRHKYESRSALEGQEFIAAETIYAFLSDALGLGDDELTAKFDELKSVIRSAMDYAQEPYFNAAMDMAMELRFRNDEVAHEIGLMKASHAKAVEDLKARAAESSARLQGLFEKASARANAAEHQLRELKSRGADAVVVSSGGVCGASLGERLAAIF